jgi:hypothetical protein
MCFTANEADEWVGSSFHVPVGKVAAGTVSVADMTFPPDGFEVN